MGFADGVLFMLVAESVLIAYSWIGWAIYHDYVND